MTSSKFGLWLLSVSALTFPVQAADSPYISQEEAVSMAITAPNNIKNTVNRSIKAEVVGLNRSFTNIATRRNALMGKSASPNDVDWSQTTNNPEDVANKINTILDLNAKPEDFIHLLEPIEEDETQENADKETNTTEKLQDQTPQNEKTISQEEPKQIIIEDDTVKHLSTRRRFGQ